MYMKFFCQTGLLTGWRPDFGDDIAHIHLADRCINTAYANFTSRIQPAPYNRFPADAACKYCKKK